MKSLLYFFAFFILVTQATAQTSVGKQITIGGNDYDYLSTMCLTKDGGLLAGGYSYSSISGNKTDTNRGVNDYWVVKLNKSGNIQWDKTFGGNREDQLTALQQTNDGGYILGGSSLSVISGEKTQGSFGFNDYWIIKLDRNGNKIWDKTFGGDKDDQLSAIQQTSDGGYILGGTSFSGISGNKTTTGRGQSDYWVIKLDANGNMQWDKTIGGKNKDFLHSLIQTHDGGFALAGESKSNISNEKTANSRGGFDYWVVKLNNNGNILWDKTIGGNNDDDIGIINETANGSLIIAGSSASGISGEKTQRSRGEYDYWILQLDSTGNIKWDKTIGGASNDFCYAIKLTADKGILLGGLSYSDKSAEKTENGFGAGDYWAIKLDAKHNIEWDKTIGGSDADELYAISEISEGHYILGGYSLSGISGNKTQKAMLSDYWLVNLNYIKPVIAETTPVIQNNNKRISATY